MIYHFNIIYLTNKLKVGKIKDKNLHFLVLHIVIEKKILFFFFYKGLNFLNCNWKKNLLTFISKIHLTEKGEGCKNLFFNKTRRLTTHLNFISFNGKLTIIKNLKIYYFYERRIQPPKQNRLSLCLQNSESILWEYSCLLYDAIISENKKKFKVIFDSSYFRMRITDFVF